MDANEAQHETFTAAKPQKEHEWLQKLVGEWTYETEAPAEPGASPERVVGTETIRSLGGLWIMAEGHGPMPGGGDATTIMTLGYDPQRQRYVGTWIGSMMTHLWVYEGSLDAAGRALSLDSEGPSMASDGSMAKYRDVIEFRSDDHRTLTAYVQGRDGKWEQMMSMDYRRK